jgi:hypothetical protein
MADNSSDDEGELGLFAEPEGYYQPEKEPTFAQHEMQDGRELKLRMVGHNPLWVRTVTAGHQGVYIDIHPKCSCHL